MTNFVVGAYAAQPADLPGQTEFYAALADTGWVDGLEVPFPGQLLEQPDILTPLLKDRFTHSVLTAIPGTMVSVWDNPNFGLGSPDADGRKAALDFTAKIRNRIEQMHTSAGHVFDWVALHSAPTSIAVPAIFRDSLAEVASWDWGDTKIVIEHCDERSTTHTPEKGFLLLEEELAVANELGLHVSLNWGRSAVGSRGDVAPAEHARIAAESGLLAGMLFSGASPEETIYGPVWIDGHLPLSTDEPASLMTPDKVAESVAALGDVELAYLGAKCCVPKDASIEQRIAMIGNIHQAVCGNR
ncbi:DUF4862 family protein [Corynebacterium choanae]|uniref:DUF4862 domain-containing protein n=1 Tax=Corynebacterium choanae TaxID=1862358 RepID=A0A3G6J5R3_9CORY|nr:DUF4862 family protein [Corynebacterium choanae]AZA13441.1 hypothetical protein CCHOA_05180 [Corynebacterium choanae]